MIYMDRTTKGSVKLIDCANALLIYFAFFVNLSDDFFEVMTFVTHAMLIAHIIFIAIVEIAFIVIKIKEYFDREE